MKKIYFLLLAGMLAGYASFAQNSFPAEGDVIIRNQDLGSRLIFVDANHAIYGRKNLQGFADALSFYEYGHIDFYTGGPIASQVQRMRISANGNVGIGTTSIDAKFVVAGSGIVQNITNLTDSDLKFWLSAPNAVDKFALISPSSTASLAFGVGSTEKMRITSNGNVGIGTTSPDTKLAVQGTIHTQEVRVDMTGWSDYVFKPAYRLPSLTEVKSYIDQNKHLPGIPSEAEVLKEGINLGEMNKLLLKKVEELTLYVIGLKEEIQKMKSKVRYHHKKNNIIK
ncbi:hypothetical protein [Mucilaginibacter lacusdianchii]|uniref:hypothetical protein n=1 Tax=Mucilaginibacter lacusdianchii TaxID=2684211 RepID=UPI00131AC21D|nr:hypothetical protein [Mucilaginibacter sp. JXJ CY 39]